MDLIKEKMNSDCPVPPNIVSTMNTSLESRMNSNYTETQLKRTLVRMLPNKLTLYGINEDILCWAGSEDYDRLNRPTRVLDTELLHLCWMVEENLDLDSDEEQVYINALGVTDRSPDEYPHYFKSICHASWQQRVIALAEVKAVEIV